MVTKKSTTVQKKVSSNKTINKKEGTPEPESFKPKLWLRLLFKASNIIGSILTAIVLFLFSIYLGFFGPLPSLDDLSQINNDLASEVYTKHGVIMGKFYRENRMSVEKKEISKHAINALVATEDSRFFEHNGYDLVSIARVLFRTILLGDERQGGGSTISQQLAKNLYPRQSFGQLSILVNKTKEIYIAARLEQVYSKNEILTLYLNTVPFGENVYGIEAASLRFFDKHSADLKANEAAVLIGMLAANTAYNPRLHPEKSKSRRNVVLSRMAEQGFLTSSEERRYKAAKLDLRYHKLDQNHGIAPYFRERIRQRALEVLEENYGDHYDLYTDGLKIYTTIDPVLQRYAEEAVQQHMAALQQEFKIHWSKQSPWASSPQVFDKELKKSPLYKSLKAAGKSDSEIRKEMSHYHKMTIFAYPKEREVNLTSMDSISHYLKILNTGFMVMDPHSGEILSWVGGVNHKYFPYDHVISRRQVGSTFKPIVYTAALQNGMTPCQYFSNERSVYENYQDWSPGNSDGKYDGYYSMKGGLTNSVNTITAKIMMETGIDKVLDLASEMGVNSKLPAVPSICLGAGDISLQEMLTAYTCYANNGRRVDAVSLLRIEDANGKILYEHKDKTSSKSVLDKDIALMMNEMLQGVVENGTGRSLHSKYGLKSQIAGKTGTTQKNADGWFIGYTPHLLAGAWVGADSPKVHFRTTALGQGAHTALPIYGLFMKKVEADKNYNKYTKARFESLSGDKKDFLTCADYLEEDPNKSIFDFITKNKHVESIYDKVNKAEARRKKKLERDRKARKGWFKRRKD